MRSTQPSNSVETTVQWERLSAVQYVERYGMLIRDMSVADAHVQNETLPPSRLPDTPIHATEAFHGTRRINPLHQGTMDSETRSPTNTRVKKHDYRSQPMCELRIHIAYVQPCGRQEQLGTEAQDMVMTIQRHQAWNTCSPHRWATIEAISRCMDQ